MKKLNKIYLVFLIFFFSALAENARAQTFTNEQVKAGYIINFTKFIVWPNQVQNQNVVMGIIGEDIFGDVLKQMLEARSKVPNNWIITNIKKPEEILSCNIVFINTLDAEIIAQVLKISQNHPILTIGNNINNFCENGGIINFNENATDKKFEINYVQARENGLIIDSRLLSVAKVISTNK